MAGGNCDETRHETRVTCSLLTAVCSSLVVTEASTAAWAAHLAAASSQLARPAPSRQHLAPTCRCRVYSGTAPGTCDLGPGTWHLAPPHLGVPGLAGGGARLLGPGALAGVGLAAADRGTDLAGEAAGEGAAARAWHSGEDVFWLEKISSLYI